MIKVRPQSIFRAAAVVVALLFARLLFAQPGAGPSIQIVEPEDDVVVHPGTNLVIRAEVNGAPTPLSVEFLRNGQSIGSTTQLPYQVRWPDIPEGRSYLRARLRYGTNILDSITIRVRAHRWDKLFTFGLDKVEGFQFKLWGNPFWQYAASLVYVILALFSASVADFFAQLVMRKWAAIGTADSPVAIIKKLKSPTRVICCVVVAQIGVEVFPLPFQIERWAVRLLSLTMTGAVTCVALRLVDFLVSRWNFKLAGQDDRAMDEQLLPVIRKTIKVFVIGIGLLFACQNIFHKDVTALLASLSIGGLAVGLAAQDTLGDLFGAMSIFVDKPFRIGDSIKLGVTEGVVETIGMRSTKLRSPEGYLVTIPNKTMGNATITNVTSRPTIKTDFNFHLPYELSAARIKQASEILREVFSKHPMTSDVVVSVNKFTESWVNILVSHTWKSTDNNAWLAGVEELHVEVKRRFDEEKIPFAVPARDIRVRPDAPAGNAGTPA